MSTFKKLSISAALLALSLGVAGQASADCVADGKIMRSYASQQSDWSYFYIARQSSGLVSYVTWFAVSPNNPALRDLLSNAHSGTQTVYVTGNADSCPTSGTARYGGTVLNANVYTLH